MGKVEITSRLNLPELLGLPDAGLDDADIDGCGNLHICDSVNGRVYRYRPDEGSVDSFDVLTASPVGLEQECSLNLAVADDSSFCVADAGREVIARYNPQGVGIGEFAAPGVLSLCQGAEGLVYVFSNAEGIERINVYDELGSQVEMLAAPARYRAHLDPSLVNLDVDPEGNVFVSYGMPPYRIWRVKADGSEIDAWSRGIDHPEDAVLIADLALDLESGVLWALLARREAGRQVIDAWNMEGEHLESLQMPQTHSLYGVLCVAGDGDLYALDTGSGSGAGDLARLSVSL